jgi:hypothetical protein
MASNYPAGYDNLNNPTAGDPLDSLQVPHAEQHANANNAVESIQQVLGTNPQGRFPTVRDRLAAIEGTGDEGNKITHLTDLWDVDVTDPVTDGALLTYDATAESWVAGSAGEAAPSALGDLSDVTLTDPQVGDVLTWDGTAWVEGAGAKGYTVSDRVPTASDGSDGDMWVTLP